MDAFFEAMGQQWVRNLLTDTTRYAIFAIGFWFILWVALKGALHSRKIRTETPPARQLLIEFAMSLRSVAVFSTVGLIPYLLEKLDLLHSHQAGVALGPVWFWICLVLMIIGHDAYFYWAHRIMHDPRLFRRFHRRHHLSHNPSPFTAYSFDIGEAAVMAAFVPLWVILVPTPWPVTGLFVLHQIVRNTIGHSGYELFPATRDGKPMFDWMTTVTHHDMHHAEARWNYGLYFTWWDRAMGTEHPQYHARFARTVMRRNKIANA